MKRHADTCIRNRVKRQLKDNGPRRLSEGPIIFPIALFVIVAAAGCAQVKPKLTSFIDRLRLGASTERTEEVTAYRLNLRKEPSTESTILALLKRGDLLRIRSQEGKWVKVLTQEGAEGWVSSYYLTGFEDRRTVSKDGSPATSQERKKLWSGGQDTQEVHTDTVIKRGTDSGGPDVPFARRDETTPSLPATQPSNLQPLPAAGDSMPLEKWVSPQGVFAVYKPKTWEVLEEYTGDSARVSLRDQSGNSGVTLYVTQNTKRMTDSLYTMGSIIGELKKECPDVRIANTRATPDRSRALTDAFYTNKGVCIKARYHFVASPESILAMGFHAPEGELADQKGLLLTVLDNISFYDKVEEDKRAKASHQRIEPITAHMVWRKAPDGSSRILAPARWAYQAGKGKVLLGSQEEDAGFVFTSIEVSSAARLPGVLHSAYMAPSQFIGVFLTQYGGASGVQVMEATRDTDPSVKQFVHMTGRQCEAQHLTARYTSKSGRVCLGTFKMINAAPSPLSGMWFSIVSGFWAPEAKFAAYVPLLVQVGDSFQIGEEYARDYIQSGLAHLQRLKQRTQQAMHQLNQARYDQQRSWEANQARKDYCSWKFSQYMRGETDWVSNLEGGKVYHTDSWGTKDTWTGDHYTGKPYDTVHFEGENPRHPSLETMREIDNFELYRKYIRGGN